MPTSSTARRFSSGVAMEIVHGHALVSARRLHVPASVVWLVLFGVHALVYLRRALTDSGREITTGRSVPGPDARTRTASRASACLKRLLALAGAGARFGSCRYRAKGVRACFRTSNGRGSSASSS